MKFMPRTVKNDLKEYIALRAILVLLTVSIVLAIEPPARPSLQSFIHHVGLGSSPHRLQLAYFFSRNGEFLVLDLPAFSVQARWLLSRVSGVANKVPEIWPRVAWGLFMVQYHPLRSRLYAVVPRATTLKVDRILILSLPSMRVVGTVDISQPLRGAPRILVSRDESQLFVNYWPDTSDDTIVSVLDIYDTRELEKTDTLKESTSRDEPIIQTQLQNWYTQEAYIGPDGKIYDRDYRISIQGSEAIKERYDPDSMLKESHRDQLRDYEKTSETGRVYLGASVIDSAAGKGVVTVAHPRGGDRAMWLADLMNNEVVSPLLLGKPSSVPHLTPDGRTVVLEGTELRTELVDGEPRRRLYKTGRFWIYDAETMELEREFEAPELAGSSYRSMVLCTAPDRPLLFYAADGGLFAVNLENAVTRKIDTPFFADNSTTCVFAIR